MLRTWLASYIAHTPQPVRRHQSVNFFHGVYQELLFNGFIAHHSRQNTISSTHKKSCYKLHIGCLPLLSACLSLKVTRNSMKREITKHADRKIVVVDASSSYPHAPRQCWQPTRPAFGVRDQGPGTFTLCVHFVKNNNFNNNATRRRTLLDLFQCTLVACDPAALLSVRCLGYWSHAQMDILFI